MIARRLVGKFGVLVLGVSLATPAFAEGPESPEAKKEAAKAFYDRGIDLYAIGDHAGALAQFQRASELAPYSVVQFNLGLTYAEVGRPVEASEVLAALVEAPGNLSAERLAKAKALLKEQTALVGTIALTADQAGAHVLIDGVDLAVTPMPKPLRVKAGKRRVSLILAGYVPLSKEIDVPGGGTAPITFEMIPTESRLAHLTINVKPIGATVLVDGVPAGVSPLPGPVTLLPGPHEVKAYRPGYQADARTITMGDGTDSAFSVELLENEAETRASGVSVLIEASEEQAVFTVDGRVRGSQNQLRLPKGPHEIRVERAGFLTVERTIDVGGAASEVIQVKLEPTPETRADFVSSATGVRIAGIVTVAAGSALMVGGGILGGVGTAQKAEVTDEIETFNAAFQPKGNCDPSKEVEDKYKTFCASGPQLNADYDAAALKQTLGFVGLGVGAATVLGGVLALALGDDPGKYDSAKSKDFAMSPVLSGDLTGFFLGVDGRF